MAYLEELLPEFRKGAKIRRRCWKPECFLFIRNGLIFDQEDCVYTSYATSILEDDWELYKDPAPDWNYIIDNKCLCWFWDEGKEERIAKFLHSVTIAPNKGFTDIDRGFWEHCCPVSKKEITFYEDKE